MPVSVTRLSPEMGCIWVDPVPETIDVLSIISGVAHIVAAAEWTRGTTQTVKEDAGHLAPGVRWDGKKLVQRNATSFRRAWLSVMESRGRCYGSTGESGELLLFNLNFPFSLICARNINLRVTRHTRSNVMIEMSLKLESDTSATSECTNDIRKLNFNIYVSTSMRRMSLLLHEQMSIYIFLYRTRHHHLIYNW